EPHEEGLGTPVGGSDLILRGPDGGASGVTARSKRTSQGRLRQVPLHEVRIPHCDARWKKALHFCLRTERRFAEISNFDGPDAIQRCALRRRSIQEDAWTV